MSDFVILKDKTKTLRSRDFDRPRPQLEFETMSGAILPEPEISTHDMDSQQLHEAAQDPDILSVARVIPTQLVTPFEGPSVADGAGSTWGISAVGADTSPATGAGIRVAVLDTGIDADHPAFAGVNLIQKDFSGDGDGDRQGHGTHCAGTVFGRDVGGLRIGVAPGVTEALIGTNLTGAIHTAHAAAAHMRARRRGHIALISSLAAKLPSADAPGYSASKAGLSAFGAALREDLAPDGIRVTLIHPGHVDTAQTDQQNGPLPLMIPPDDAARRIVAGLSGGKTDISFPPLASLWVRTLARLPWRWRARLERANRFTVTNRDPE